MLNKLHLVARWSPTASPEDRALIRIMSPEDHCHQRWRLGMEGGGCCGLVGDRSDDGDGMAAVGTQ